MIRLKAHGAILEGVDEIAINPAHVSVVVLDGKTLRIGMVSMPDGDEILFDTELQARMLFDVLVSQ